MFEAFNNLGSGIIITHKFLWPWQGASFCFLVLVFFGACLGPSPIQEPSGIPGNDEYLGFSFLSNGETVVAGYRRHDINLDFNPLIIFFDSLGRSLDVFNFGGSQNDQVNGVISITDSEFVAGGHSQSSGLGITDFYLVHFNRQGKSLRETFFGGPGLDQFFSLAPTALGGGLAVGFSTPMSLDESTGVAVRFDNGLGTVWKKSFPKTPINNYRGSGFFGASSAPNNGFLIGGFINHQVLGKRIYLVRVTVAFHRIYRVSA